MTAQGTGLGRLRRMATAPPPPVVEEQCEFCSVDLGERHGHVADVAEHRLLCVCRPCYLLFAPEVSGGRGSARGRGRSPCRRAASRRRHVGVVACPVDLVFLLPPVWPRRRRAPPAAFYPGPGGATESELDLHAWSRIVADNPAFDQTMSDVEAVLLRRHDRVFTATWCRSTSATSWSALWAPRGRSSGGRPEVWDRMREFFDELDRRGREVPRSGAA